MNLAIEAPSRGVHAFCVPGHSPRQPPGGPPEERIDDEHERRGTPKPGVRHATNRRPCVLSPAGV